MFNPVTPRHFPWLENREVGVVLTGGLGNQLFQVAAGIALAERHGVPLAVVDTVLQPRSGPNGQAEIFSLLESHQGVIRVVPQETDRTLGIRAAQWRIASCNGGYGWVQRHLRSFLATLVELVENGVPRHACTRLWSQRGNGYDARFERIGVNRLLIGYFQSYLYTSRLRLPPSILFRLSSKPSEKFLQLKDDAESAPFIAVHVRRGDYRLHPHFGLLSRDYYSRALSLLKDHSPDINLVRIFSDDFRSARELFEELDTNHEFIFVDDRGLSTSETLILMSLGDAFVIANSSMSYWAAKISGGSAAVTYPDPWFASHPGPRDLVSPAWLSVKSSF